jgi:hypothetical protein
MRCIPGRTELSEEDVMYTKERKFSSMVRVLMPSSPRAHDGTIQ